MSTDNKKILLTLFIIIDCLLGVLVIKSLNNQSVSFDQSSTLKSKGNKYDVTKDEKEINEIMPTIVYENYTYEQLVGKINISLNDDLANKGNLIVDKSLELGIDPFLVTAIMLQETGCKWNCSYLVKACNNVGGQKGYGCGSYSSFETLDEGIVAMISNLYYNYYAKGLTTAETINPIYAEDYNWSNNVNRYISELRNN